MERGRNLFVVLSPQLSEYWRDFAREFHLEFDDRGHHAIDHFAYDEHLDDGSHTTLVVPLDASASPFVSESTRAGPPLLYRGVAHGYPRQPLLANILHASPTAFGADPSSTDALTEETYLTGTSTGLVSSFQAKNNARVTFVGSLDLFSDQFVDAPVARVGGTACVDRFSRDGSQTLLMLIGCCSYPQSGNAAFNRDISSWTFHERGVLRVEQSAHSRARDSKTADLYRVREELVSISSRVDSLVAKYTDGFFRVRSSTQSTCRRSQRARGVPSNPTIFNSSSPCSTHTCASPWFPQRASTLRLRATALASARQTSMASSPSRSTTDVPAGPTWRTRRPCPSRLLVTTSTIASSRELSHTTVVPRAFPSRRLPLLSPGRCNEPKRVISRLRKPLLTDVASLDLRQHDCQMCIAARFKASELAIVRVAANVTVNTDMVTRSCTLLKAEPRTSKERDGEMRVRKRSSPTPHTTVSDSRRPGVLKMRESPKSCTKEAECQTCRRSNVRVRGVDLPHTRAKGSIAGLLPERRHTGEASLPDPPLSVCRTPDEHRESGEERLQPGQGR